MTIEKAIAIIETAKAEVEWSYPLEYAQAFEMAIDALRALLRQNNARRRTGAWQRKEYINE